MKHRSMFSRIRLSYYYPILFALSLVLITQTEKITLTGGQLTLFSVNSLLLAFYLGLILAAQKVRIEELHKAVRGEAIAMQLVLHKIKDAPAETRAQVTDRVKTYIAACNRTRSVIEGEREYDKLIASLAGYKGRGADELAAAYEVVINNKQNRGQISVLLASGVYSHEWVVLGVLFMVTISYVMLIDYGSVQLLSYVAALLCTGMSLLLVILQKLNSLTHKKAKTIWRPFDELLAHDLES